MKKAVIPEGFCRESPISLLFVVVGQALPDNAPPGHLSFPVPLVGEVRRSRVGGWQKVFPLKLSLNLFQGLARLLFKSRSKIGPKNT